MTPKTAAGPSRSYTLTPAALEQRQRAARKGILARAATARNWTALKVAQPVVDAIDARRGELSRNAWLERLLGL